jgi:glutamyl-tRNA synthetase
VTVRTRIAPSPTGDPHVGTAYTALANYCFAKKNHGVFLLRIEDTDQARSTPESERAILDALHWTGLSWDEGPDVGGPHAPYRQSERSAIYKRYVEELLDHGHAFRCFCTPERLEEMRMLQRAAKQPPRYDGQCLRLSQEDIADNLATGKPFVIRMKVPERGLFTFNDARRGRIEIDWSTVDMQILMKSDGLPTYHLANVVDDHLMEITHVIRGEEWVSSAPKHLLLYKYFQWEPPVLMHLPLLRNPDKSKLSKRKNPTSILFYKRMGYLPEALLNFLGILIAPPPEGQEIADLPTLIERFSFEHVSLGGPVFDVAKLDWLNGKYLRELDDEAFVNRAVTWGFDRDRLKRIAALAHSRVERLSDLGLLTAFFFAGRLPVKKEDFDHGKIDLEASRKSLALAMWDLDAEREFDKGVIERVLKNVSDMLGLRFRDLARVYYVAMTGSPASVPLFDAMEILGRDMCRERFRVAIDVLGGVSNAEQKSWRSERPADDLVGATP